MKFEKAQADPEMGHIGDFAGNNEIFTLRFLDFPVLTFIKVGKVDAWEERSGQSAKVEWGVFRYIFLPIRFPPLLPVFLLSGITGISLIRHADGLSILG
ncbi:MAG: hypothetical protein EA399_11620 [Desulfovibrionales bacterium]|nr:MAG: hypothetical protein EA399_11620 [Desulfovibrionales bacterium]